MKQTNYEVDKPDSYFKKIVHADGGSFTEPPKYRPHDAYFVVVDTTGNYIKFNRDLGNLWSGLAEYESIKWCVENIKERPLKIYNDCITAMAWARKGSSETSKFRVSPLNLEDVTLWHLSNNLADQWIDANHSPKESKEFYIKRHRDICGVRGHLCRKRDKSPPLFA
ncbi:hypothetical protein LCGC14_1072580 [marine sediment metagenome]|uniref:RNase H type-1 domain-containing protein n=1 Tax=marine sediment metagenome TaxID=412755 RepID=A0A0F9MMQ2_9ZZZZ